MIAAKRNINDPVGWVSSSLEWWALWWVAQDEQVLLSPCLINLHLHLHFGPLGTFAAVFACSRAKGCSQFRALTAELCRVPQGLLSKERVRASYDGSLWFILEREYARKREAGRKQRRAAPRAQPHKIRATD